MKMMKKIGVIVLAIMMIALVVTAWAADNSDGDTVTDGIAGNVNGVWAAKDTPVAQTAKTAILYKEIKAYNPDRSTINAPTITYTYTIKPGSSNKEIYDDDENHASGVNARVLTKTGITTGVKVNNGTPGTASSAVGTVTWDPAIENDRLLALSTGEKNTKTISIDFSGVSFLGAGVYRYEIEETVSRYNNSGVVEGTTGHTRYLDVYVKDGSTAGSYDIYGFVCFVNNNDIDAKDSPTTSTVAAALKTEGFVEVLDPNNDNNHDDDMLADQYYTYNVKIVKDLVNDQAKNSNQFPFQVLFHNSTVIDSVLPIVTKSDSGATAPILTKGNLNNFAVDGNSSTVSQQLKLADDGWVQFTGIPAGTKVTIDEYNNVSGTTYTTTTSGATENESDGSSLTWNTWTFSVSTWADDTNGTKRVYTLTNTADTNEAATQNYEVKFTNTLLQISPTGIVTRFAPYALILVGGIVLLIIAKKHKKNTDED